MKSAAQMRAAARSLAGNSGDVREITDRECVAAWMGGKHVSLPQNPLVWKGIAVARKAVPVTHSESMRQGNGNYERHFPVARAMAANGLRVEYKHGNVSISVFTKYGAGKPK